MDNKTETPNIQVERVDDIPVLYGHLEKMRVRAILDQVLEPHGNWQGLSPGWVLTIWLIHILSQHTHCMDRVRGWVVRHQHTLQALTGQTITELDFTDDRLALCLRMLSAPGVWAEIETRLGQHIVRVYRLTDLRTVVRLDATTGRVYHTPEDSTLFQVGRAKDGEFATLYKLMLASLDPLGLTVAVDVEAGQRADDPLYVPCYERVKQVLPEPGLLIVGDTKMSALATRATIAAGQDVYLTPFPQRATEQQLLEDLVTPWEGRAEQLTRIFLPEDLPDDGSDPDPELALAQGFEVQRTRQMTVGEEVVTWTERLLVVQSVAFADSRRQRLRQRLDAAEQALQALTPPPGRGKRQMRTQEQLDAAIQQIEDRYRVAGYFDYAYHREETTRHVRAYGDRPARTERQVRYELTVTRQAEAIAHAEFMAGWRIYGTNATAEQLSLAQAVLAYRGQYIVENVFRRLQGKLLSITPVYVQRDDHARGLFHFLSLGARVLALGDYTARRALAAAGAELTGIYHGNPKRGTATPTTERLLEAFEHLNLLIIAEGGQLRYQITPLNAVQQRILALWDLPASLYTRLAAA